MTFKFRKETIMDKKKDYEIKVDGTPNTFKGGAIRYNKNKGRFDLIQEDVVIRLLRKIYNIESLVIANKGEILEDAFAGRYDDAIIKLSCWYYCEMTDETGAVFQGHEVMRYFIKMLPDLAILFQKGAQKYGERNCEAGIPLWSFRDSGLRHLTQYFNGIEDEPHYIHAIWNFCLADWTIHNHPERCYKPESKGEVNKDKTPEIPDEKCDDSVKYNESDAKVCEKQFKDEHKKHDDCMDALMYSLQNLLDSGKFKEVKLDDIEKSYTSRNLINDIYHYISDSWVYCDEHISDFLNTLRQNSQSTGTRTRTAFVLDSVYGPRSDNAFADAFNWLVFKKKVPDGSLRCRKTDFILYMIECLKMPIIPKVNYTIENIPDEYYQTFKHKFQVLFWKECILPIFDDVENFIDMFPETKEFSKMDGFDRKVFTRAVQRLNFNNDPENNGVVLLTYDEERHIKAYSENIGSCEKLIQKFSNFSNARMCIAKFNSEFMNPSIVVKIVKKRERDD